MTVDGMVTPLQGLIPIMDMVKVVANDEFEALFPKFQPSQVTITTADGKKYTKRVDVPKGDPRDPMTEEEIGVKFTALGKDVVGEARCRELGAGHHEAGAAEVGGAVDGLDGEVATGAVPIDTDQSDSAVIRLKTLPPTCKLSSRRSSPAAVARRFKLRTAADLFTSMQNGDEIRSFTNSRRHWKARSGRRGYALLRNGLVVEAVLSVLN